MYDVPRDETSATFAITGFPHATVDTKVSVCARKRTGGRTDDGLRDLDGGDETVLVKGGGGEGEVVVRRLAVQRVDIRREADAVHAHTHSQTRPSQTRTRLYLPNEEEPLGPAAVHPLSGLYGLDTEMGILLLLDLPRELGVDFWDCVLGERVEGRGRFLFVLERHRWLRGGREQAEREASDMVMAGLYTVPCAFGEISGVV